MIRSAIGRGKVRSAHPTSRGKVRSAHPTSRVRCTLRTLQVG